MAKQEHKENEEEQAVSKEQVAKIDLSGIGVRDDPASRTVASRQRLRDQINDDVEAFLAKGGKIDQVDASVSADPPKRPESNYGQRPI